jgi:DNA repair exonuclease SbcCD ATPase subunit
MRDPTENGEAQTESVIPFAPTHEATDRNGGDQLDQAGESILRLLHKAAGVAEENSRSALDMARKLSHQLRAAENRVAELEAELETYRDRAERAEQWLHRVYSEIEERFVHHVPSDGRRSSTQRRTTR